MIEMELRALLTNKLQVKRKLEQHGCKWEAIGIQIDTIYERCDMQQIVNMPIFRIRRSDEKKLLTLKVFMEDLDTAEEFEIEISDDIIMDKMLQRIGFLPKIQVVKRRQFVEYGKFIICMDEIDELGDFIEIENISEKNDEKDKIYGEMKTILLELGVKEDEIKKEKYYEMMIRKQGEKNE